MWRLFNFLFGWQYAWIEYGSTWNIHRIQKIKNKLYFRYDGDWKFSFSYLTFFMSKWFDGDVNDGYMKFNKKLIDTMREEN